MLDLVEDRERLTAPAAASAENERLAALERYDILDTPTEEGFDRITRLVRRVMRVPISTVTLIDGHRQWFKSSDGMPVRESARGPAFCNMVVGHGRPLVVSDTLADPRYRDNPMVHGDPPVRFYAGAPLLTPDGHAIGALCAIDTQPRTILPEDMETLSDLAGIVMSELELRVVATTDSLTGALSRRAFRAEAGRSLALAVRHRHPLSGLMIDLDRLRDVNDRFGRARGDLLLRRTAETIAANLRRSDLLGRVGGEEFAVALPHTGLASATAVAEKIRAAVEAQPLTDLGGIRPVTVSIGVVALDRSAQDIDGFIARAEVALRQAKADGRNRWQVWRGIEPDTAAARRVFKAGRIAFNGGRSTIDCTVRLLSDTGAGVDVISTAAIPDQFKLVIEADNVSRLCTLVSKTETRLNLRFA